MGYERTTLRDAITRACGTHANLHWQDPLWVQISAAFDWQDAWPLVNKDGLLTGDVILAGDDTLTTFDYGAVIRPEDAKAGGWEIDTEEGLARQPKRK